MQEPSVELWICQGCPSLGPLRYCRIAAGDYLDTVTQVSLTPPTCHFLRKPPRGALHYNAQKYDCFSVRSYRTSVEANKVLVLDAVSASCSSRLCNSDRIVCWLIWMTVVIVLSILSPYCVANKFPAWKESLSTREPIDGAITAIRMVKRITGDISKCNVASWASYEGVWFSNCNCWSRRLVTRALTKIHCNRSNLIEAMLVVSIIKQDTAYKFGIPYQTYFRGHKLCINTLLRTIERDYAIVV